MAETTPRQETPDDLAKQVMNLQKQMEEVREPREAVWKDIISYVLPGLEDLLMEERPRGGRTGTSVYDGTGISALQLFADGLFGYLVSPSIPWFRLRMPPQARQLDDVPQVKAWLEETASALYAAFARSNWYESIAFFFEVGGALGTAAIYSEEDVGSGRIVYTVPHPGEVYIAEDRYGRASRVHRKLQLEAGKAWEMFGDALDPTIVNAAKTTPFKRFPFIHAVYPRERRDPARLDSRNKPLASVWVDVTHAKVVRESGYNLQPYGVWRYKRGTTPYGTSPAEEALVEILGLNEISKSLLGAAQLAVEPAYNVPAEMRGRVRIVPRGMNYYEEPNRVVSPVHTGINFPVGVDREAQMRRAVEKHFKVDFFIMLAQAQAQAMTATQVIEMQAEKAAVLARPINRLNSEVLGPAIDRAFQIELEAGRIPPPPDIVYETQVSEIDVEYMGPLAQAQRRLFETQGLSQALGAAEPIFALAPESLDNIDFDEALRRILDSYGFPARAQRPPDAVAALRRARARMQAQETRKEDLERLAGGIKTLAEADRAAGGLPPEIVQALGGEVGAAGGGAVPGPEEVVE